MSDAQRDAAIANISNVSSMLREAIRAAIPVAPEQYLTVSIPGTVIDTRDVDEGGTLVYDATRPFIPTSVRQEESRLVDKMVPLAYVMVGNTGKSVARSYTRALDSLLPRKAEIKDSDGQIRSPGSKLYNDSMAKLKLKDPETGLTPIDVYIEKQAAWAASQSEWDEAKIAAQDAAMSNLDNMTKDGTVDRVKVQQEYNDWSQAHYRKYKYAVQGRYMDWVANGNKYEVENDFGIVDVDSIMSRVEDSKESMRNSTIVDADGSNELHIVNLTPRNWATECMLRAQGWYAKNGDFSIDQLYAEIDRLRRLRISYEVLRKDTVDAQGNPIYPITDAATPVVGNPDEESDDALQAAISDVYAKRADLNKRISERRADPAKPQSDIDTAEEALKEAELKMKRVTIKNREFNARLAKSKVALLSDGNKDKLKAWIDAQQKDIDDQLAGLELKKASKMGVNEVTLPVVQPPNGDESNTADDGGEIAAENATKAAPIFGIQTTDPSGATTSVRKSDPWTTISASFKATQQTQVADQSDWGASFGGGAGFGLWSIGGSYAHEESKSDSVSDMASCDVSITFSAMVVNVDRPWLYAELFNDHELDVADDVLLSPGAEALTIMMKNQTDKDSNKAANAIAYLAQYANFPAFPTSFLLAADTTIEFTGNTSHIETHFSSQSNSGSLSVGWGPFHVSSSFHQSSSHSNFQMQTTATGCKLTFGAPSIIGWVSQIIPELPRKSGFEPMVQNKKPNIVPIPPMLPGR